MKTLSFLAVPLVVIAVFAATPICAETAPARVEITLANFSFTPSAIQLHGGQQVTLHFVNNGSGGHDFTAPEFFKTAMMDAAIRAKLGKKGKVSLESGTSMDVTLTPKVGSYKAKCSHFLHAGFGMTGTISVN
ncbi:MAG: cupredoxin domain-containing protein [Sphingorhabdus sp.]